MEHNSWHKRKNKKYQKLKYLISFLLVELVEHLIWRPMVMWSLLNLLPNLRWLTPFRWLTSLFNFTFKEDVHDEGRPERVTSNIDWSFLRRFKALYTVQWTIPSLTKWSTTCGFFQPLISINMYYEMYYGYSTYYSRYYSSILHTIVCTTVKNASTYYGPTLINS